MHEQRSRLAPGGGGMRVPDHGGAEACRRRIRGLRGGRRELVQNSVGIPGRRLPGRVVQSGGDKIWGGVNVLALVGIAMVWIHWATRDGQERAAAAPKVGLSRKLIGFFGGTALCFSIGFVAQWLGIAEPCGACFRSIATSVFSRADGRREIDFERLGERDTRMQS